MGVKIPLIVGNFVHESLRLNQSSDVVCLLEWWAANCSITESLRSPRTYPTSKTEPRWGPGRPALMASRLEMTRSIWMVILFVC